ncbi:MAG: cytochrome C [Myxococcaceae bacterium]
MEHARHIFRVLLVLVVLIAGFIVFRTWMVPDTYGFYGSYRFSNVAEQAARPPRHGGSESCQKCHPKQYGKKLAGVHKTVSCEVCHGPVSLHAAAEKRIAPASVEKTYKLCARCHAKLESRPKEFPQVVLEEHVNDKLEGGICLDCHDPHDPTP